MPTKIRALSIDNRITKRKRSTYSENSEYEHLNLDVLMNCVSDLTLFKCFAQEKVNKRLANVQKSNYNRERVSLVIYFDMPEIVQVGNGTVLFTLELTGQRRFNDESSRKLKIDSTQLRQALEQIFQRCKNFHRLTLRPINGDFIVKSVVDAAMVESSSNLVVKKLFFNPGACDIANATNLISSLSSSLKTLHMRVGDDAEDYVYSCPSKADPDSQKQFWSAVSQCRQLKKLLWSPVHKNEHENVHISECLKILKIKHFKYNNRDFSAEWLFTSFEQNGNLRHLFTGDVDILCSPKLNSIIAQLKTLGICHGTRCADKKSIVTVARAMNEKASIVALESLCNADDMSAISKASEAIAFWLQIANETGKYVKLQIGMFNGPPCEALIDKTMEQLVAIETFRRYELHETRDSCKKILLWRGAKVKFAFVDGYNDDLFDSWVIPG